MRKLEDFNADRQKYYDLQRKMDKPYRNRIQCPQCGGELWDSNPMMILISNPPERSIYCPNCGYRSYRLA